MPTKSTGAASNEMLRYTTKAAAAYAAVREMIMRNDLPAGEPVNQDNLAKALGTSVTPLREAFRKLESEGFVKNEPHRGVVVTSLDLGELEKLFVVKVDLECLSARLASAMATEVQRKNITAKALALDNTPEHFSDWEANRAFHAAIYTASDNSYLIGALDTIWARYDRYSRVFSEVVFSDPTAADEHSQIAEAIARGDAEAADRLMKQHHMHTLELTQSASAKVLF